MNEPTKEEALLTEEEQDKARKDMIRICAKPVGGSTHLSAKTKRFLTYDALCAAQLAKVAPIYQAKIEALEARVRLAESRLTHEHQRLEQSQARIKELEFNMSQERERVLKVLDDYYDLDWDEFCQKYKLAADADAWDAKVTIRESLKVGKEAKS